MQLLKNDLLSIFSIGLILPLLLVCLIDLSLAPPLIASPNSSDYISANLFDQDYNIVETDTSKEKDSDREFNAASEKDTASIQYQPYESKRSIPEHLLATPSYLLHWSTRPLGWGIKYVEANYPHWFKGERAPYGIYPLFELGGDVFGEAGLLLYHNKIGAKHHQVRMEVTAGVDGYREVDFDYMLPNNNVSSITDRVRLEIEYKDDPKESLFYNNPGNDRRTFYTFERFRSDLTYNINIGQNNKWSLYGGYRNTNIGISDKREDNEEFEFVRFPTDSVGRTKLGSIGSRITLDYTEGVKRTVRGSRYIGEINLNQALTSNDLQFLSYHLEWQQFLPLPMLPENRRLAFKSQLDKALLLDGNRLPFYELPDLGGGKSLRGSRSHRYRDKGSLLLTLEYRYPIWGFADAVIFMDKGQVFYEYEDIDVQDWHNSYGFGFHLLSGNNFAFRSEFAFSRDYSRIILSISPNF